MAKSGIEAAARSMNDFCNPTCHPRPKSVILEEDGRGRKNEFQPMDKRGDDA
jgi:hypothetical protein